MIHVIAFTATLLACVIFVLSVGGKPERAAVLAQLLAYLATVFVLSFRSKLFEHLPIGLALVDVVLAAVLTLLALKANRLWPIVLAGMQLAPIFAHLAEALSFPLPAAGYSIFVQFWGWPMLIVTGLGAVRHRQRIRRFGEEQDWKPLWPHSTHSQSTG